MEKVSKTNEVLEGYAALWKWMVDSWTTYATGVVTKLESGKYGPADASADMQACSELSSDSAMRVAAEGMDAMAIFASSIDKPYILMSNDTFVTSASPTGRRTLSLAAPLTAQGGMVTLEASRVTFRPSVLFKDEKEFRIIADGTGVTPGNYKGTANVTDATGHVEPVAVSIII